MPDDSAQGQPQPPNTSVDEPGPRRPSWLSAGSILLVLAVAAAITWQVWPVSKTVSGHQQMLTLLREIAERSPDDNPWYPGGQARNLKRRLDALPAGGSNFDRVVLHAQLGQVQAWLGDNDNAVKNLEAAYRMLPSIRKLIKLKDVIETTYRVGIGYLRLGETENCCQRNTPDSCLLPIRGEGIHTKPYGSTEAIRMFTKVLELTDGKHLRARWLLNIAYMTLGQYPDGVPAAFLIGPEVFASDQPFPRFHNIAGRLGVNTFNRVGSVIADDFDNDGYLDILTSTWDPTGPMNFFHNNHDGSFSDQTEAAGLKGLFGGLNMVQADYDNDGDVDVYILRGAWLDPDEWHPNSLLRNNGDGSFTDVTFEAGLGEVHYATQTGSWADYDNDGDVDLYVGNEQPKGSPIPAPCQLFRNNGDGTFTDVAAQAGVRNFEFAKSVIWGDYDADRFPDLYVSNLAGPNRLYHNNGDGTFTNVAAKLKVNLPRFSFPIWFWDYDNDGVLDLLVTSYQGEAPALKEFVASYLGMPHGLETHKLYQGDGRGGFQDVTVECNLTRLAYPMGCNFGDLDNDGYLDFYLGTGYPDFEALMPNVMYRNVDGKRFADVTINGGFGHLQKGHGVAFADFDQDGDQDIFEQMGGSFPGDKFSDSFYENPGFGNRWLTIKLVGVRSNRSAIGARIRAVIVEDGKDRSIYKHVNSGGPFGASPLRQTIGLGKASKVRRLEVYWPTTDKTQVFHDVEMDRVLRLVEGEEQFTELHLKRFDLSPDRPR